MENSKGRGGVHDKLVHGKMVMVNSTEIPDWNWRKKTISSGVNAIKLKISGDYGKIERLEVQWGNFKKKIDILNIGEQYFPGKVQYTIRSKSL